MPLLKQWLDDARASSGLPNPDALALATVDERGDPAVRIVLCKQLIVDPGYLVFYTNYQSPKAADIKHSGTTAGVFHWDLLGRQARITGIALRSPAEESDRYFASRDRASQLGAWSSQQSQPLESRHELLEAHRRAAERFGLALDDPSEQAPAIPRPANWGGYRIWIDSVELWVRGEARLHDRALWRRTLEKDSERSFRAAAWTGHRLQP